LTDVSLIVGLGNPGKDYEYTRHNFGFLVVARLAEQYKLKVSSSSLCKGLTAGGMIQDKTCCLLFPLTYMNNSGIAVRDDFSLDFGQLRLRPSGSDGGHNGLDSVIAQLNSKDFSRLRLGIGPVPNKKDAVDFVLQEFTSAEKKKLDDFIQEAVDCCVAWITGNSDQVMSQFNRKKDT